MINQEIKQSLYEHEIMTPSQIAMLHSYRKNSIYKYLQKMSKDGEVLKIDVPAIGRGSKAFYLSSDSARNIASERNESHMFREKDWKKAPSSILNTLVGNQFFTELIRASRDEPTMGLTEWIGRRSLLQRYGNEENEKRSTPSMNGYGVLHYGDKKYLVHLVVLSGNETVNVLKDLLIYHTQAIQSHYPSKTSKVLLLFVYLGKRSGELVMKSWRNLTQDTSVEPFIASASFEHLAIEGIFSSVWTTIESEGISLLDMPSMKSSSTKEEDFLGKKQIIRFQFRSIPGFHRNEDSTNHIKKATREMNVQASNGDENPQRQSENAGAKSTNPHFSLSTIKQEQQDNPQDQDINWI